MTAYVIYGLTLAKQAGYEVDEQRIARGRDKLQNILASGSDNIVEDGDTRAFMVYVLAESGGVDNWRIDKLFAERNNLQPYGRALLALALARQQMDQRALEVAGEIERSAQVTRSSAHWEAQARFAIWFSYGPNRRNSDVVESAGADQTQEFVAAARRSLARFGKTQWLLLALDQRHGFRNLRSR